MPKISQNAIGYVFLKGSPETPKAEQSNSGSTHSTRHDEQSSQRMEAGRAERITENSLFLEETDRDGRRDRGGQSMRTATPRLLVVKPKVRILYDRLLPPA